MEPGKDIRDLDVARPTVAVPYISQRRGADCTSAPPEAAVTLGALLTFVGNLDGQGRDDVLKSVQLAQRAADARHDRFGQTEQWYAIYGEVMKRVGWTTQQEMRIKQSEKEGRATINKEALALLAAFATQNALGILSGGLQALQKMTEDGVLEFFEINSLAGEHGNIQIGVAERDPSGAINLAMGAFQFRARDRKGGFLSLIFQTKDLQFWATAQKMILDVPAYEQVRSAVIEKLNGAEEFIARIGSLESSII